jgi:thioredoxin-related protein
MASTHPHFDDKGLKWHTKLADALAEAKATDKHVLIEYGRAACSACRALVQNVMPSPQIRAELEKSFVLLATDCDHPEPEVRQLGAKNMPHARALPFVMYLRSDGTFVFGTQGGRDPHGFAHDLIHGREDPDHHHHD